MTQTEIKKLASEIIGDGQSPNQWFVTQSSYVRREVDGSWDIDHSLIDGYTNDDTCTFGPFESYEDAVERYHDIELDVDYGVGQVMIEDRLIGTVREKFLTEHVQVTYTEHEIDDSRFYK